jgi:hypothetical protein
MKRHRTVLLSACSLFAFVVPALAQQGPFEKYIFDVHEHRQSSELADFAKQCGVAAPAPTQQRFALGRDGWHPAKDIAKEVARADSDFLATAEIWLVDDKPRMVITWSTNAEGAQEQLSCIDSAEKVTAQQINSWSTQGSGLDEVKITKGLNKQGELVQTAAEFVPATGARRPMTPQMLANELYQYGAKYPDNRSLSDYQFPAILFKPVKPGKR